MLAHAQKGHNSEDRLQEILRLERRCLTARVGALVPASRWALVSHLLLDRSLLDHFLYHLVVLLLRTDNALVRHGSRHRVSGARTLRGRLIRRILKVGRSRWPSFLEIYRHSLGQLRKQIRAVGRLRVHDRSGSKSRLGTGRCCCNIILDGRVVLGMLGVKYGRIVSARDVLLTLL